MSEWLVAIVVIGIAATSISTGYRWSRLDHNPWKGRALGGTFYKPNPAFLRPADLDVADINRRGRRLMILSPILSALFLAFYLSHQ